MMFKVFSFFIIYFAINVFLVLDCFGQSNKVILGAYYFDGWQKNNSQHITKVLVDSFPEREPKWGWVTSTQSIVDQQILEASSSGITFFNFCFYYNNTSTFKNEPLNNALELYHKSRYINKLKYSLMIANHAGFECSPNNWNDFVNDIIPYLKHKQYVNIKGEPLLTFFSLNTLIKNFGSATEVNKALRLLRDTAYKKGIKGLKLAVCCNTNSDIIFSAEKCGFDILTGYNYHTLVLNKLNEYSNIKKFPLDSMRKVEVEIWNDISRKSNLPYIPVSTLNWDPRPWSNSSNNYSNEPYFIGYSPESVFYSVKQLINWIKSNSFYKIGFIYAWNESGEGAWLLPTKKSLNDKRLNTRNIVDHASKLKFSDNMLDGLRSAILKK